MRLPISRPQLVAIAVAIAALLSALGLVADDDTKTPAPAPTPIATVVPVTAAAAFPAPGAFPDTQMAEPGDTQPPVTISARAASAGTFAGCITRFNTHNYSSRNGAAVRAIAPHYTVSRNIIGWADVNSVADFLNRLTTGASAHFIIDGEGNCLYTVPVEMKAWTEMNGNPFSIGIEFIAYGDEGQLTPAAIAKGGQLIAELAAKYSIPLQVGDVSGCSPRRPGLADHAMFGACGGCHHDLRPFYGTPIPRSCALPAAADSARVLGPLLRAARSHGVTAVDRRTCRKLNWWRKHGRPHGKPERNAVRRRQALAGRGVRCTASGPVRS